MGGAWPLVCHDDRGWVLSGNTTNTNGISDVAILKSQIDRLTRRVSELEQTPQDREIRSQKDVRWSCPKCGTTLGFYDPDAETLRIRYRQALFVTIRVGPGGWVEQPCPTCGQTVVAHYQPPEGSEPSGS